MIPPVNPRRFALLIRRELLEMVYTPTVWFYVLFAAAFVLFAAFSPVDGLFDGAVGTVVSFVSAASSGALLILPLAFLAWGMLGLFVPGLGQRDVWQDTNRQHDRAMLPASRAEKHAAKLATGAWVLPFAFWFLTTVFAEAGIGIISHDGTREITGGAVIFYEGNIGFALAMYWICFHATFLLVCRFGLPPRWVTSASIAVFVMVPLMAPLVFLLGGAEIRGWEVPPMWLVAGVIAAFPIWLSVCRRDGRVFAASAKQTENKKDKKEKEDKTPRDAFAFAVPEKMSCLRRAAVLALTPEYRRMFYYCAAMAVLLPALWMLAEWYFYERDALDYGFEIRLYGLLMNLFAVMITATCVSAIVVSARAHVFFSLPASRAEKCAAIFAATYAAPMFVISLTSFPWFAFYAGEFNALVASHAAGASVKAAWSFALIHSAVMLGFACGANRTARGNYEWVTAVVLAVLFLLFAADFLSGVFPVSSFYASGASMEGYSFAEDAARDLWRDNAGAAHLITEYWRAARGFFYAATPPVFWFLAWLKWQRG